MPHIYRMHRSIENLASASLDAVFPRRCILCGAIVGSVPWSPAPLCTSCERTLECIRGPRCGRCGRQLISEQDYCVECRGEEAALSRIVPLFEFRGGAARLIHAYKIGERVSLAQYFAYKIAQEKTFSDPAPGDFFLVPVPPRPEKVRSGKLDQVGVIAEALARFGFRHRRPLVRLPGGGQQKLLDRAERLKNASASYALAPSGQIPGRVVLLDDVCTTGATLEACAKLLIQAGAEVIGAIVLAAD